MKNNSKTVVSVDIVRQMTDELPFIEQYQLEELNCGKKFWAGIVSALFAVAICLMIGVLWFKTDSLFLTIFLGLVTIPISTICAIKINLKERFLKRTFTEIVIKVRKFEGVFKLGDTSGDRKDIIVGKVRRNLIEECKRLIEWNTDKEKIGFVRILSGKLDLAKECLGSILDDNRGFDRFWKLAWKEINDKTVLENLKG